MTSAVPSNTAKTFSNLPKDSRNGPKTAMKARSQSRMNSQIACLPMDLRRVIFSTIIAHQSSPSETSAISPAPIGGAAFGPAIRTVSSAITSAIGCASMALTVSGRAKRSIQVEALCASADVLVFFIADGSNELMPHLPSAYMMYRQVIDICTHYTIGITRQGEVDDCTVRP